MRAFYATVAPYSARSGCKVHHIGAVLNSAQCALPSGALRFAINVQRQATAAAARYGLHVSRAAARNVHSLARSFIKSMRLAPDLASIRIDELVLCTVQLVLSSHQARRSSRKSA